MISQIYRTTIPKKFVYEVKHRKQVVIEMYSVVKEGKEYKISKQNTVSKSAWTGNTD